MQIQLPPTAPATTRDHAEDLLAMWRAASADVAAAYARWADAHRSAAREAYTAYVAASEREDAAAAAYERLARAV
jgi:hypothetical protein